jgi:hypothetical protein
MYRRPYAAYLNAIAALIASLLFLGAIATGTFKSVAKADTQVYAKGLMSHPR